MRGEGAAGNVRAGEVGSVKQGWGHKTADGALRMLDRKGRPQSWSTRALLIQRGFPYRPYVSLHFCP